MSPQLEVVMDAQLRRITAALHQPYQPRTPVAVLRSKVAMKQFRAERQLKPFGGVCRTRACFQQVAPGVRLCGVCREKRAAKERARWLARKAASHAA